MIDPSERKALLEVIERFEGAYIDMVQASMRLLRILDMESREAGLPTVLEQPNRVETPRPKDVRPEPSTTPVLPDGKVDPKPVAKFKAEPKLSGDACRECGMFMLVRVGTCIRCNSCGWDSGCG
jgi:outer membrane biosynthesis protein TonB